MYSFEVRTAHLLQRSRSSSKGRWYSPTFGSRSAVLESNGGYSSRPIPSPLVSEQSEISCRFVLVGTWALAGTIQTRGRCRHSLGLAASSSHPPTELSQLLRYAQGSCQTRTHPNRRNAIGQRTNPPACQGSATGFIVRSRRVTGSPQVQGWPSAGAYEPSCVRCRGRGPG